MRRVAGVGRALQLAACSSSSSSSIAQAEAEPAASSIADASQMDKGEKGQRWMQAHMHHTW